MIPIIVVSYKWAISEKSLVYEVYRKKTSKGRNHSIHLFTEWLNTQRYSYEEVFEEANFMCILQE